MKSWLITGASTGLGRIMTERLLERGDRVAATVRRAGALDVPATRHGDRLRTITVDLTDTNGMRREIEAAFAALGRIDVVVSNAGYGLFGAAEEVSDAQIERQIATNLTASIQFIRACLPHLRRQGGGRIVQVSSEGGQTTYPAFGLYHATKWGIEGFVETVAKEVGAFGIDCLIVEPGPTATGFRGNIDRAVPLTSYEATPAGEMRRLIASGTFAIKGDAERTVSAMIAAADADRPPLRLALGSVAYDHVVASLEERLASVRAHKAVAYSADRDEAASL